MFSIVIPIYNKSLTIQDTLASVLAQDFMAFEILAVDDGSTDNSIELIGAFNDERIRIISKTNGGVSSARNFGIERATNPWIVFLDADDTWDRTFLQTLALLISKHPDEKVFATGYNIQQNGRPAVHPIFYNIKPGEKVVITNYFEVAGNGANVLTSSSTCVHHSVFSVTGNFPIGEKLGEDQHLWIRIALHFDIVFCNKPLVFYNIGETSAVKNLIPDDRLVHIELLKSLAGNDRVPGAKKYLDKELFHIARVNILQHNPSFGRRVIFNSNFSYFPLKKLAWVVFSYIMQIKNKKGA